jgi:hypothetical protein
MKDTFFDDNDDNLDCHSNFGESTGFGNYIEDLGGSGAQIRDSEEVITIGKDGVESELRGFGEQNSPLMNIWVEEILDTIGPDQGEGAGPFEVCSDFELQDYIMFRTCSFEEVWNKEKKEFTLKKGSLIRWDLNPVDAINYAREVYHINELRWHYDRAYVAKRLNELNERDPTSGMALRFRSWMKTRYHTDPLDLVPFHFEYEPVTEDLMTVNDAERTAHEQYDEAFMKEMEELKRSEDRPHECHRENEGKLEDLPSPEEMRYRARTKEERERRAQNILSWIERAPTQSVSEAFQRGGRFHKFLQESRKVCLKPSGSFRTRFKTPAELYLTKEQADRCTSAAAEKLKNI